MLQLNSGYEESKTGGQTARKFEVDKLELNLQTNERGLYECRGRIQGDYPIYLPDEDVYSEKLVMHAHEETQHGGVGLTMAAVRQLLDTTSETFGKANHKKLLRM